VDRNGTIPHGPDEPLTASAGKLHRLVRGLARRGGRWLKELSGVFQRGPVPETPPHPVSRPSRSYLPLRRVLLTDGVSRTLFEEYASHRESPRGNEETGWILLGLRDEDEFVAVATLPAGTERDAGVAHVRFNDEAQTIGCRFVRQYDRRLVTLGVVHTHPGSLRHPSDADYRGDVQWIGLLRGKEGVFGIGTADAPAPSSGLVGRHPRPNVQCWGGLQLSWYALAEGDRNYRPLPVELTLGPDLARPLHSIWPTIETHAERLDRLVRQQARVAFEVVNGSRGMVLSVLVPLAEPGDAIRVLLDEKEVCYLLERGGEVLAADPHETRVDQGVYLLLAELASQS
jgi:proteasome lid subunit RPN8/RPN11